MESEGFAIYDSLMQLKNEVMLKYELSACEMQTCK